eukprot:4177995-Amphidinium_carterae.1
MKILQDPITSASQICLAMHAVLAFNPVRGVGALHPCSCHPPRRADMHKGEGYVNYTTVSRWSPSGKVQPSCKFKP